MNIEEARKNLGRMVMSTDPGRKMIRELPAHGPYRLEKVTQDGMAMLLGRTLHVAPRHLTLYEEPTHATEERRNCGRILPSSAKAPPEPTSSIFLVLEYNPPTCSDSILGVFLDRFKAEAFAATHTHGPTPVRVEEWKDGTHGPVDTNTH